MLTPLFQRYASNPNILSWEAVNEPDFNTGSATPAQIRDMVGKIGIAVHASAPGTLFAVNGTQTGFVGNWTWAPTLHGRRLRWSAIVAPTRQAGAHRRGEPRPVAAGI